MRFPLRLAVPVALLTALSLFLLACTQAQPRPGGVRPQRRPERGSSPELRQRRLCHLPPEPPVGPGNGSGH